MATAVEAAFFLSGAFSVAITALHAGRCKATGSVWRWTAALLYRQHRLKELTAGHTLPLLLGKHPLNWLEGDRLASWAG